MRFCRATKANPVPSSRRTLAIGSFQPQKIKEIRIAKDRVGRHLAVAEVGDFRGDDLLGVLGQGRPLEQHAADLFPERLDVPAFDAAHLGVKLTGERVLDGEQFQ
jgi:hypothetical protein